MRDTIREGIEGGKGGKGKGRPDVPEDSVVVEKSILQDLQKQVEELKKALKL